MDYQLFKEKCKEYFVHRQIMAACLVALVALLAAFLVLFRSPVPGVMDFGEYTQTLYEMGNFQPFKLLQITPTRSLIYPVSMTAFLCEITGNPFSTRLMAYLMVLVAVGCLYSITKSLYYFINDYAVAAGMALILLVFNGNYAIYFNSMLNHGVFLLGLLIYFTVCLQIVSHPDKKGLKEAIKLLAASLFLLNAAEAAVFMLPAIVMGDLALLLHCSPAKGKKAAYYIISGLLLLFVIRTNVLFFTQSPSVQSKERLYHSLFTGILEQTEEPEIILKELGLDASLCDDIGKTAYFPDEAYVVSPRDHEAEEQIFSHLNGKKLATVLQKHPDIYRNILKETVAASLTSSSARFLYEGKHTGEGVEWVERMHYWQFLRRILVPESLMTFILFTLISGAVIVCEIVRNCRNRAKRGLAVTALTGLFMAILPFACVFTFFGFADKEQLKLYIMLPLDFMLLACCMFVLVKFGQLTAFLGIGTKEIYDVDLNPESPLGVLAKYYGNRIKKAFLEQLLDYPVRCGWLFGLLSAVIVGWTLFAAPGIGAYNNGDFGRMMEAMNLRYTEEDWANAEELALTKVVEKYDWVEEYDYTKIMPYHADLTQAWFSLPVKIIDNYVGLQFNTRYVAAMYAVITAICMGIIMKVLFRRFGRKFLISALVLMMILLDLGNLGWFNSLFGEGIAFVGLLMVMASSLYVIDGQRGSCRLSLFVLFFSILIFTGSKAQFTLSTPVLLLWAGILFLYHAPCKIWKKLCYFSFFLAGCLWISQSAVSVYRHNEHISSPDTIYQSVFYGLLMISEDDEAVLTELGLDSVLAADEGKHAYLDKSEYFCAPRTPKAQEMIYSRISTTDMLFYYLKHPDKLWTILDITAQAAAEPLPDFTLYRGEKTTQEHHVVNRVRFWRDIRETLVFDRFWQLLLLYGTELLCGAGLLCRRKTCKKDKLLMGLFLCMSLTGLIQFPLTFIGNGFADNTKQLYLFRLTYDITFFLGIYLLFLGIGSLLHRTKERLNQQQGIRIPCFGEKQGERREQDEA